MMSDRSPEGSAEGGASLVPACESEAGLAAWRNGRKRSIGIGKTVVELFSAAISVSVWR